MANFAQEFPCLVFLPFFTFVAIAAIWAMVHLAILVEARLKKPRAARTARPLVQPAKPGLVISFEDQLSRLKTQPARLGPPRLGPPRLRPIPTKL